MSHGLTPHCLNKIRKILLKNCSSIERVGLFGSRALGQHKDISDIDLVLYGNISEEEGDRLHTCFLESLVSLKVDIVVYNHIAHLPLKKHIDNAVVILFTKEQLQY